MSACLPASHCMYLCLYIFVMMICNSTRAAVVVVIVIYPFATVRLYVSVCGCACHCISAYSFGNPYLTLHLNGSIFDNIRQPLLDSSRFQCVAEYTYINIKHILGVIGEEGQYFARQLPIKLFSATDFGNACKYIRKYTENPMCV